MVSVGRTPPRTANRHIQVDSLNDLSALKSVEFDKVIYIIGNTDHHNMEKELLDPGEPTAFDYHVIPLVQTMEQLKHYPIRKFIHFSTILIYDEKKMTLPISEHSPIDPYKNRYVLSKYMAEEVSKFYARWIPTITVRFSNLYGPTPLERYDLIHILSRKLLAEGRAQVWSTKPQRDFIYVDDAAEAIIRLLDTDYMGTLNLGTGTMTSVGRIVEILQEMSGLPITVLDKPVQGPMEFVCDMTTLHNLIDWKANVTIEEGVKSVYEKTKVWWKDRT